MNFGIKMLFSTLATIAIIGTMAHQYLTAWTAATIGLAGIALYLCYRLRKIERMIE